MPTKLGQNFLKDPIVLEKIIQASDITKADFVLEIGPGEGVLTEKLAPFGKKVIAIEIDDTLIEPLKNKFAANKNVVIWHDDILRLHLPQLLQEQAPLRADHYQAIANIPYYITSPIIRLFLEQEHQPQEMILMIQKEVAERIVAPQGQLSILAVSVGYYATTEILFLVDKKSFDPMPKVDSAVIRITPRRKFNKIEDKKFFRLVKAGFSAKRKTLLNNLSTSLQIKKEVVEKILLQLSLDTHTRAQELTIADWEKLATLFSDTNA
ncbi:MAG: 16S rRNA (adenine(1518)-N(6)/adenine(1519)-N(6))-dimethyltransferase RsmA [Parcubacteria group bacterium]|jgi:16S rRNA (adenine1518-N6/adenine1519-N6)-dimethyltransferase